LKIQKKNVLRRILGIGIAGIAGFAAARLNVPLPWMIGPLVVIAAASASGFSLRLPPASRQIGQVVIGTAIGLHFTPMVARYVAQFSVYIWGAAFASIALGGMLSLLFARTGSISRTTAFFASMPGGVAEMAVLAERYGGEPGLVALAQSIRVMFIVIVVPFALVCLDVTGTDMETELQLPLRPAGLVIMLASAVAAAFVLWKIRIVNAWLLGPLTVGILVALNEWPLSQVPQVFINAGQVLIGAALGLRFRRELILGLRRFLPAAIFNTAILVLGSAALAAVIAAWTGLQISNMVLALAPGGVAEMSITAQVLHLGVPLVTAFHVTRMIVVILLSGPIFRGLRYLSARRKPA
jgi:hypothetical protein